MAGSLGCCRIGRWILNISAAFSLILFIATVVLWVRSYRIGDTGGYLHSDPPGLHAIDWGYWMLSARGRIEFAHFLDDYTDPVTISQQMRERYQSHWTWSSERALSNRPAGNDVDTHLGMGFRIGHTGYFYGTNKNWVLVLPHGILCVLTLAIPFWWLKAHRQRRWLNSAELKGLCPACHYDIRATPERCPECGRSLSEPVS